MGVPIEVKDLLDDAFQFVESNGFFLLLFFGVFQYCRYYFISPWLSMKRKQWALSKAQNPSRVSSLDEKRAKALDRLSASYVVDAKERSLERHKKLKQREERKKKYDAFGYNPLTGTGSSRGGGGFKSSRTNGPSGKRGG
jgi:hypothetical protein